SWLFLFVLGIPLILSVLYYSSDTRFLFSLPLKAAEIISAKMTIVYLYMIPIHAAVLFPSLVIYSREIPFTPGLGMAWFVSAVFGPLIPLSFAAVLVILISRIVNVSRHKTAFEVAGMLLALILVVGFQAFLSRTMFGAGRGGTFSGFNQLPGIYGALAKAVLPLDWFAEGFTGHGGFMMTAAAVLSAALTAAALIVLKVTYIKDFSKRMETPGKKDKTVFNRQQFTGTTAKNSLLLSLVKREWAILSSNSTFIFEAAGEVFVLPLVVIVFKFVSPENIIFMIKTIISGTKLSGLLVFGVLVLMIGINGVSATSLSREGRAFYLSLSLPLPGNLQIKAKWIFHLLLFYPAYILDAALVYFVLKIPVIDLVYIIPGGFVFITLSFIVNIYFDVKRPLLKWTHPQQAMKQNMNVLAGMSFSLLVVVIFGFLSAGLIKLHMDILLTGLVITAAGGTAAIVLFRCLGKYAEHRYGYELEMD
ncbi:MAG: hypothetical protein GXP33_04880, partial [Spirochaetes bacterium]|nr:hypothetical protein [Spirochaetota bacterium]